MSIKKQYKNFGKIQLKRAEGMSSSNGYKTYNMKIGLMNKIKERYGFQARDKIDCYYTKRYIVGEVFKWAIGIGYVEFVYDIEADHMISWQSNIH
jgi:hypothetical protein